MLLLKNLVSIHSSSSLLTYTLLHTWLLSGTQSATILRRPFIPTTPAVMLSGQVSVSGQISGSACEPGTNVRASSAQ